MKTNPITSVINTALEGIESQRREIKSIDKEVKRTWITAVIVLVLMIVIVIIY